MFSHNIPLFVKFIVLFQLFTNFIIILDVMIIRQVIGFIYLTFIPGIVVVKMLRLGREDFSTIILFSVGLSVAFLMLIGFAINELIPLIGVSRPLSIIPLLFAMNVFVLLPCLLGYLKNAKISISSRKIPFRVLFFVFLPFLSIIGAFLVNAFGNTSLLLFVIVVISALTVLTALNENFLLSNWVPFALFLVALTLLLHTSLITNYIVGWDVHSEYHVFKITDNAARWSSEFQSWDDRIAKGNAMLSTTVLPTIYSKVLNIDGTLIFKIIYPLIVAFVPFVLFKLYSTQTSKKAAFLGVFFLMSNLSFFSADSFAAKQMTAQLFFVLLFFVILTERAGTFKREFLFMIFGFALVVSHYSTSYIFFFLVLLTWLFRILFHGQKRNTGITLSEVLLFFTMAFTWYIYTSAAAPFDAVLNTSGHLFSTVFVDFFNPEARTATVLRGLGVGEVPVSVWQQISRIVFYIIEVFIVVGFVKLLFERRKSTFTSQYSMLSSVSMVMLGMAVILPNLAGSFRMERFYQISLLFLAPVCILGGKTILEFLLKRKDDAIIVNLILLVLIPNFLFQTGFVYAITGDVTYSLPFGMSETDEVRRLIIYEKEVRGAEWLSTYTRSLTIYADYFSGFHVLTSYGLFSTEDVSLLSKYTESLGNGSYTFLRRENVVEGTMVARELTVPFVVINTSDISQWLSIQNLIYSNGDSQIFIGTQQQNSSASG